MGRRVFASGLAVALVVLALLVLPHLTAIQPTARPERDPLAALGVYAPRPLTARQVAALARYSRLTSALDPPTLSRPPALKLPEEGFPRRFVLAGESLRYAPAPGGAIVGTVAAGGLVPVLSERHGWALIRSAGTQGWVEASRLVRLGEPVGDSPPLGSAPTPTLPLAGRAANPQQLERARGQLDNAHTRSGRLGPWNLLTDIEDSEALSSFDRVASRVEQAYRLRYRLAPVGEPLETVVLFADEGAYQRFRRSQGSPSGDRVGGHATAGLVAVAVGARETEAAAESLVHELTHLLNRRAIGPALPPWLDEGLANDLGLSRIAADGSLALGTLSGRRHASGGDEIRIDGGEANALIARRRLGSLVPLERLLAMGPEEFLRTPESELHYAQSLLFVRYLLDGANGAHREAFLSFLAAVAAGAEIDPEAFRAHLGPSWPRLQAAFESWLGFSVVP